MNIGSLIASIGGDTRPLEEALKRAKEEMNSASSQITNSTNQINNGFRDMGMMVVKAAAAYATFETAKKAIENVHWAEEELERVNTGLAEGFQYLSQSMLNGNWTGFIDNLQKAITGGAELQRQLQELEMAGRGVSVATSKMEYELQKYREEASNFLDDPKNRLVNVRAAIGIQTQMNKLEAEHALKAKNIALDLLGLETTLSREKIENFLTEYNHVEDLRLAAENYGKALKTMKTFGISDFQLESMQKARKAQEALINPTNNPDIKFTWAGDTLDLITKATPIVKEYWEELEKGANGNTSKWNEATEAISRYWKTLAGGEAALRGLNRQYKQIYGLQKEGEGVFGGGIKLKLDTKMPFDLRWSINLAKQNRKALIASIIEPWKEIQTQITQIGDGIEVHTTGTFTKIRGQLVADIGAISTVMIDWGKQMENLATGAITTLADSLGNSLGKALTGKSGAWQGFFDNFLLMVADWAIKLGGLMVAAGIAASAFWKALMSGPHGAVAAIAIGAALIVAGAAVKGAMAAPKSMGGVAGSGGGGSGESPDLTGRRRLQQFQVDVTGEVIIDGTKLRLVLANEEDRRTY